MKYKFIKTINQIQSQLDLGKTCTNYPLVPLFTFYLLHFNSFIVYLFAQLLWKSLDCIKQYLKTVHSYSPNYGGRNCNLIQHKQQILFLWEIIS